MDTTDLRLHTSSIRADIAFRAGRYDDAVVWLDAHARDRSRTLPGAVPVDCAVLESVGARGRGPTRTMRESRSKRPGRCPTSPAGTAGPSSSRRARRCSTATPDGIDRGHRGGARDHAARHRAHASRRRRVIGGRASGAVAARSARPLRERPARRSTPTGSGRRSATRAAPCPAPAPSPGSRA